MFRYIVSLGSNIAPSHEHFDVALRQMREIEIVVLQESQRIVTKPLAHPELSTDDHDNYLNSIAVLETRLDPDALYKKCRQIEDAIGHTRIRRWAPRAMDIDLLLFGTLKTNMPGANFDLSQQEWVPWQSDTVTCPHPQLFKRNFLLHLLGTFGVQLWTKDNDI